MSNFKINHEFKSSRNPNKVERNFYKVWSEMKRRCSNKTTKRNNKSYFDKGVKICERWKDFNFFFIDMWESYLLHRESNYEDTELDRINNEEGYSKVNCRWVTRLENMNNTGNVRKLNGKTFSQWADELGIDRRTLLQRYYAYGWSIERTLSAKLEKRGPKKKGSLLK